MSAYIQMTTPMTDRECLLLALADMGFGSDKVVVTSEPAHLVGYRGNMRSQVAEVIIPRKFVGVSSNDIGFSMTPHGYRAQISEFDSRQYGSEWLAQVSAHYRKHWAQKRRRLAEAEKRREEEERRRLVQQQKKAIYERARKMGYSVKETRSEGKIRLVLVKRSY